MEKGKTLRAFIGALSILVVLVGVGAANPTDSALAAGATNSTSANTAATTQLAQVAQAKRKKKGWRPKFGTTFNYARSSAGTMWRVEAQIKAAINHARKGSTIRISLFSWDRYPMVDAVIRAKKRGVHVQVVLNDHQNNGAMRKLKKALGTKRTKKSFYHVCRNSCRGTFENLHTKMVLFSKTGVKRKVSMVGSFNFTGNAAINQHNDLFTFQHRKGYKSLRNLFQELARDKPVKVRHRHYKKAFGRYLMETTPMPMRKKGDPALRVLNKVRCKGAKNTATGRTVLRVGMHTVSGARGTWLANKLRSLFAQGCNVRLWYGFADRSARNAFATKTKRGYMPVHVAGYDTNADGVIDLYGHHKVVAIRGRYKGAGSVNHVWTGSSNWGNAGLRGDEMLFRIRSAKIFNNYNANFDQIWYKHSHLAKYIPYRAATSLRTTSGWNAIAPEPELRVPDDWEF